MKKLLLILILLFPLFPKAEELTIDAPSAILMEYSTGKILYEKNADERMAPASMTKIMTILLIEEAIQRGELSLIDDVIISNNASSMGGSQVFLDPNTTLKVEDLLKSIVIASANDSAVAMAEKIAGTVDAFVNKMNERAKELGCTNTNFVNVHGLDTDNHYTTARDMAIIARELIKHEDIFKYTTIYESYLNKPDGTSIWMVNTNKLIKYYNGLDGLKTGFTKNAGYCLTSTAKRNDMRLISVIMKEETSQKRNEETTKLLDYGFTNYKIKTIVSSKDNIGSIYIFNSKKENYDLTLINDATNLEGVNDQNNYSYNINLDNVKAPLKVGDKIGTLDIISNGSIIKNIDITVKEDVKKANLFDLMKRNIKLALTL